VALSGNGAVEAFAGYRRYWGQLYAPGWSLLPAWLRDGLIGAALRRLRRLAAHASGSEFERQAGWTREPDDVALDRLLPASRGAGVEPDALIASLREAARDDDSIDRMLASDLALGLPGDMLVKVDRMSMANGLEVRAPFLNQRVVECAAPMPGAVKLGREGWRPQGKRILRRAFRDRLPAEVFARPKRGFEMPVATLLRTTLAGRLAEAIRPSALRRQGLFDPDLPAIWWLQLQLGKRDTSGRLWSLLLFQEWARMHRRPEALA
jgi:asparagine synthase (glutamine-hydrolysing)